jgi:hypothetical protein
MKPWRIPPRQKGLTAATVLLAAVNELVL